jgi:GNAT superfamily N-acetyltransferase
LIRRATPDDAAAMVRVINAAYEVERFFVDGERIDAAEIADNLRDHVMLVLEEDGAVTGCVLVKRAGARGYFGLLSVDPARQGGGRARRLIEAAEALCRDAGCTAMDILVVDLREELFPFYRRFGYVEQEVLPWPDQAMTRLRRPAGFVRMSKEL